MRIDPIFERVFRKLYGKPCWGVRNCVGSDITFEFGRPHLEIREPMIASPKSSKRIRELYARRGVHVHGEWHLWVWWSDWEIFQKGKRLGSDRSRSNFERAVRSLDGQKLVKFSINHSGMRCVFEFDLGGILLTYAYNPEGDQWQLFEPSGHVLTLRGDKKYSYTRSNQANYAGPWKPVAISRK